MLDRRAFVLLLGAALTAGCSQGSSLSPEAERGRQVYAAQCTRATRAIPRRTGRSALP
jgi:hypothetical protein